MKIASSYLKMRVLGAIDAVPGSSRIARIRAVADLVFTDEDGHPRQFTWRTIQTWYSRYQQHGVTGMGTASRTDKGKPRKTTPEEVVEAINAALPHFRDQAVNKMAIYRYCIEHGLLHAEQISRTTFFRFIREHELLNPQAETKQRQAFAMQYANQLWQADTLYGPYVQTKQTYLIAFLDDASRVLCHGEFVMADSTDNLIKALRSAFYKRGTPEALYVDNGSNYSSQEITLICARVGCILRHTPVRDGAAKGKIERFFRRVREQFLIRTLDLSTLAVLNRQFTDWVENEYNATTHSAIGMKPIDRFGIDLKRIRYLPPNDVNDELFYAEAERTVKKDNTFSFQNQRFETPVDLRGKIITIRYDRANPDSRLIIFYKDQRQGEARLVDLIANGQRRRTQEGHA